MVRVNKINGMLTTRDLARLLNVHINTVRRWSDLGLLETYRFGPRGDRRFKTGDIATFLADNREVVKGENGNGSRH